MVVRPEAMIHIPTVFAIPGTWIPAFQPE